MISTHRIVMVFVLSFLLGGCAATVKKTGDAAPIKVGAGATKSIVLAITGGKDAFRDLNTGEVWGERHYDTSSTAWQGVFSPMTDKQVRAICKEIATTLSGH